ncbi:RNA polymerase II transcription factor B subunit 4, putative [Hepatocystis sp. ex Piliocolobus tephrosceles]|nr:RNA polymerase II transcription factor B subunit 4, putative [Hepatocystis sp. ex Piliocolobus tephrosceles]
MHKNVDSQNILLKDAELTKNVIIIVIDVNFIIWCEGIVIQFDKKLSKNIKLWDLLKSIFQFIRLYCHMSNSERICLIAASSTRCKIIYENYISYAKNNLTQKDIYSDMYDKLINFIKDTKDYKHVESNMSSALAIALCYNKRMCTLYEHINTRIFLLDISKHNFYTKQYTQLMNIAYNAKRKDIIIDVFSLNYKTKLLEQICNITNGLYIDKDIFLNMSCTDNINDILTQTIIFWYLPSKNARKYFSNTYLNEDTNIAVCSCHNKQVDIAFICSCCLSIYCSEKDTNTDRDRIVCSICKTRFTKHLLRNKTVTDLDFVTM